MKAIAPIIFMVLMSAFSIYGQTERPDRSLENQKQDTVKRQAFRYPWGNFDIYRDRVPVPELKPDLDPKRFYHKSPRVVIPYGERPEERYPGSERFYAKRPFLFSPYRKPFVLKPDSTVKYYLIIKDPITHRVIK